MSRRKQRQEERLLDNNSAEQAVSAESAESIESTKSEDTMLAASDEGWTEHGLLVERRDGGYTRVPAGKLFALRRASVAGAAALAAYLDNIQTQFRPGCRIVPEQEVRALLADL